MSPCLSPRRISAENSRAVLVGETQDRVVNQEGWDFIGPHAQQKKEESLLKKINQDHFLLFLGRRAFPRKKKKKGSTQSKVGLCVSRWRKGSRNQGEHPCLSDLKSLTAVGGLEEFQPIFKEIYDYDRSPIYTYN